jgi:hypothetical protein
MGTGKKFIIVLMMAVEEMIEMNVQEVLTRIISWNDNALDVDHK